MTVHSLNPEDSQQHKSTSQPATFVSRGGIKLAAALDAFNLDVSNFFCADLGCNVGGFTDCLLQRNAEQVIAVDTGYGALAWKLRQDPRVIVAERTNALHCEPTELGASATDLVTIDLAWTKQSHAIPAAMRWNPRFIISLVKPHYEAPRETMQQRKGGILDADDAESIFKEVLAAFPTLGVTPVKHILSPIKGGAGKKRKGNAEYLVLLEPTG